VLVAARSALTVETSHGHGRLLARARIPIPRAVRREVSAGCVERPGVARACCATSITPIYLAIGNSEFGHPARIRYALARRIMNAAALIVDGVYQRECTISGGPPSVRSNRIVLDGLRGEVETPPLAHLSSI